MVEIEEKADVTGRKKIAECSQALLRSASITHMPASGRCLVFGGSAFRRQCTRSGPWVVFYT
jgi:hypothetical protein